MRVIKPLPKAEEIHFDWQPIPQLTWSNAEKSAKPSGELSLLEAPGGGGRDGPAPPGGGGRLGGGGRRGGAALFFGGRAGVGESEGNPPLCIDVLF